LRQYSPEQWKHFHEYLSIQGFSSEKFLQIIGNNPKLLCTPIQRINESLDCWRTCQFGGYLTTQLLTTYPELFDITNKNEVNLKVSTLSQYVGTTKNALKVLMNSPTVVRDKTELILAKIKYLRDEMKVDPVEVTHCAVFSQTMEKIRCRHQFLVRLGLYKLKNPKADESEKSTNNKLSSIFDTSDKKFATKICFVSLEEYEVFEQLFDRELERNAGKQRDIDEVDDDEEFEENSDEKNTVP
jgi:mTERF domain-containing protein, mitochondrial